MGDGGGLGLSSWALWSYGGQSGVLGSRGVEPEVSLALPNCLSILPLKEVGNGKEAPRTGIQKIGVGPGIWVFNS